MSEMNGQPLPPGWTVTRLGNLGDYINGRGFKKSEWGRVGLPIIRIQDLTGSNARPNYFNGEVDERHVVMPGDFLISWAATLGAYIWKGPKGVLNQHIFKVRSHIDKHFHVSLIHRVLADMLRRAHGTGMVHITKGEFDRTLVPVPPLSEQIRIAEKLDEILSGLDAGVAALDRTKAKLKRYRAAVLKAAVEGALTAEWRARNLTAEPASVLLTRILAERRRRWEQAQLQKFNGAAKKPPKNWKAKYQEPVEPDATNLPPLPEGWCWSAIDQIGETQGGLQKSPGRTPTKNHYPYLRVANVHRGALDLEEVHRFELTVAELTRLRLEVGDLLIVEGNGSRTEIGRCAMWEGEIADCVHQNHIIRFRPLEGAVSKYINLFLNSPVGQKAIQWVASSTSGLYTLSVGKIEKLPLPIPPTIEQHEVVERVEDQLSIIDHLEADLEAKLKSAQALRQSILRHAFTGQLVPQDPGDEPAVELLQRIAAQREERARQAGAAKRAKSKAKTPRKRAVGQTQ